MFHHHPTLAIRGGRGRSRQARFATDDAGVPSRLRAGTTKTRAIALKTGHDVNRLGLPHGCPSPGVERREHPLADVVEHAETIDA